MYSNITPGHQRNGIDPSFVCFCAAVPDVDWLGFIFIVCSLRGINALWHCMEEKKPPKNICLLCSRHCEKSFSVIISQSNEDNSGSSPSVMETRSRCLLSPVLTAFVSIKISMSRAFYCLGGFSFSLPSIWSCFSACFFLFIMSHCKPIRGAIIDSIILWHQ